MSHQNSQSGTRVCTLVWEQGKNERGGFFSEKKATCIVASHKTRYLLVHSFPTTRESSIHYNPFQRPEVSKVYAFYRQNPFGSASFKSRNLPPVGTVFTHTHHYFYHLGHKVPNTPRPETHITLLDPNLLRLLRILLTQHVGSRIRSLTTY